MSKMTNPRNVSSRAEDIAVASSALPGGEVES
jgi:hypothetical protein